LWKLNTFGMNLFVIRSIHCICWNKSCKLTEGKKKVDEIGIYPGRFEGREDRMIQLVYSLSVRSYQLTTFTFQRMIIIKL